MILFTFTGYRLCSFFSVTMRKSTFILQLMMIMMMMMVEINITHSKFVTPGMERLQYSTAYDSSVSRPHYSLPFGVKKIHA